MNLKNLKIGTQLRLGLSIILFFVLLLGGLAWRQTDLLWLQTKTMYDHPLQVRRALGALEADIMGMRLEFHNLLQEGNEQGRQTALQNGDLYQADAEKQFNIIFERYLGPRADIENAHNAFVRWLSLRESNKALVKGGKLREARHRLENTGGIGRQRDLLLAQIRKIDAFAIAKGDALYLEATTLNNSLNRQLAMVVGGILLLSLWVGYLLLQLIRAPLLELTEVAERFHQGEMAARSGYWSANEVGLLATTFNGLADTIQAELAFREKATQLSAVMLQELQARAFGLAVLEPLMRLTGSQIGAIYLLNNSKSDYEHLESIGLDKAGLTTFSATTHEGEFGAVLSSGKIQRITAIADDSRFTFTVVSGEFKPREIITIPLPAGSEIPAIISLASLQSYAPAAVRLITDMQVALAAWMNSILANRRIESMAEDLAEQNRRLQTQQEELRVANEELEEQTQRLQQSEEELKTGQEELQVTNEELEEKNSLLEQQTREVEHARQQIEEKAAALALASKYKSEFLANMSHELRTPLNSLLLLSQSLAANREGNLTPEQVEAARIIHGGGSDLLTLINEILDLAKIEAGRIELQQGSVMISDLADGARESFQHLAEEKGISLDVIIAAGAPVEITSDHNRLEQIIRNLIANAIKFTESGGVTITFGAPAPSTGLSLSDYLAIAVRDSGIGIPPEQHRLIFEAFQQADSGTSRKYGGTGLGLSISRELASLLGGEIYLESEPGKGSTFTLIVPISEHQSPLEKSETPKLQAKNGNRQIAIPDDRDNITSGDRVMLVIEDDPDFARLLWNKCHDKGFKCLVAPTGEEGLELAVHYLPGALVLDLRLPGMDGWAVLSALKEDIRTRHIPVHIISAEEPTTRSLHHGAIGHFAKPINQEELEEAFLKLEQLSSGKMKRLLVVDDDPVIRHATVQLVGNGDVTTDEAENGEQALAALRSEKYDCVVLDMGLPDMDGNELLLGLEREGVSLPPVIVYTARNLTSDEETAIRERADSIVIKDVRSQERLLDEVSLFLHRVVNRMSDKKRQVIQTLHDSDALLQGKKILVVDDDMRTTFAVANLLAENGMKPLKAENGARALRLLEEQPDIDLVLMDVMMPVMDGYETIERIRAQEQFRTLPIIVLTAKAMPEDREKCLAAGASDYLPKPLDRGRLFSLMRVWLCR